MPRKCYITGLISETPFTPNLLQENNVVRDHMAIHWQRNFQTFTFMVDTHRPLLDKLRILQLCKSIHKPINTGKKNQKPKNKNKNKLLGNLESRLTFCIFAHSCINFTILSMLWNTFLHTLLKLSVWPFCVSSKFIGRTVCWG